MTPRTLSRKACLAQINAPALPVRTLREQRINRLSFLNREIARNQKDAAYHLSTGHPERASIFESTIARQRAERDALLTPL